MDKNGHTKRTNMKANILKRRPKFSHSMHEITRARSYEHEKHIPQHWLNKLSPKNPQITWKNPKLPKTILRFPTGCTGGWVENGWKNAWPVQPKQVNTQPSRALETLVFSVSNCGVILGILNFMGGVHHGYTFERKGVLHPSKMKGDGVSENLVGWGSISFRKSG